MYFLMCFLVHVFGTITGKITTEYLTPGYYRPVTGVIQSGLRFACLFRSPDLRLGTRKFVPVKLLQCSASELALGFVALGRYTFSGAVPRWLVRCTCPRPHRVVQEVPFQICQIAWRVSASQYNTPVNLFVHLGNDYNTASEDREV